MSQEAPTRLLTLAVFGEKTSLSKSTIRREIQKGNISAVKVGKAVRISEEELQRFIASLPRSV